MAKKLIIGITGSFATGKTTVSSMFQDLGAKVINADEIVHSLIDKNTRKRLAQVVFQHKEYLDKLCHIIYPFVINRIRELTRMYKNKIIVIDAPLLIEAGLHKDVDFLIVVKAKKTIQIKRAIKKAKISRGDVLNRIKFQLPLRKKIDLADFVIDNNGSFLKTKRQVEKIWREIEKNS